MKWNDNNTITVLPPKNPKKITGTRFGAILGQNKWNTPFKAWCEITRTYEEPFADTKYTIAGKTIEPKQAKYMADIYGMSIKTPEDLFGKDYFKRTRGDFFPESKFFGGMWDYLEYQNGKPVAVLEMKTSQRVEDWKDDIPEYYALQAALYAYLLGVNQVYMVASFLEASDYDNPEEFEPSTDNTIIRSFQLYERYPNFDAIIEDAVEFWTNHVDTGISPEYTDKDKDIVKELKTTYVNPDTDLNNLVIELEDLKAKIDSIKKGILGDYEKRYKLISSQIKEILESQLADDTDVATVSGQHFTVTLTKTNKETVDVDMMKVNGIYENYVINETSTRLTIKENK